MAEDIVQDALIRAFVHLGTLRDSDRFVPWLQRIVRNQAYMKMRRGGPYRQELPFSSFARQENPGHNTDGSDIGSTTDWTDIDHILFRLSHSTSEEARQRQDPTQIVLQAEVIRTLRYLLHCLGPRERGIFEAHFFGELPPSLIASLFGTTTGNVYTTLSRAKAKVARERIRLSLNAYVHKRATLGLPKRVVLAAPPI